MWWLQVHQLRSKDLTARRKAAAALAENPSWRAIRGLAAGSHDQDAIVRVSCITALSKLDDERRIDPMLEALKDPVPEVVRAALHGLRKSVDPRLGAAAIGLIRHQDAAVRGLAAQIVEQQGWQPPNLEATAWWHVARGHFSRAASLGPAAVPALECAIQQGPFSISAAAVQALSDMEGPLAIKLLLSALRAEEPVVCVAALEVLSRSGMAEARPAVIGMLKHRDAHVRSAAAEASGAMGIAESVPELQGLLKDSSWEVRRSAVEALGRLKDPRCLASLCAALTDPDEDVQQTAAMSVGEMKDPRAIPALVYGLVSSASGTRRLAAAALARIDENWSVTPEAMTAAQEVRAAIAGGDADARFFFEQLFTSAAKLQMPARGANSVSSQPAPADRDQHHKLAVSILLSLLAEGDAAIRQAATEALGRLREKRAETAVAKLLADSDLSVSASAVEALASIQHS